MKHTIRSPLGLPCNRPPYGRLSAVDLATGDIVWQRPFGNLRDVTPLPIDLEIGLPNYGGPLLTGSGLVFIGATIGPYLRVYTARPARSSGAHDSPPAARLHR
ncbi:MAG: hypothetical protein ACREI8_05435 [Myxococcota bacterium]